MVKKILAILLSSLLLLSAGFAGGWLLHDRSALFTIAGFRASVADARRDSEQNRRYSEFLRAGIRGIGSDLEAGTGQLGLGVEKALGLGTYPKQLRGIAEEIRRISSTLREAITDAKNLGGGSVDSPDSVVVPIGGM